MFYALVYQFKKINLHRLLFYAFSALFILVPSIIILFKALTPAEGQPLSENLAFVNSSLWSSLFRSLFVACWTLVFVLVISYPFAYLVANLQSRSWKIVVMSLVTSPLWSSFFVKLIGLKSFFDLMLGEMHSTRGLLYVVIGLVYLNLPIAILTFYNCLNHIPKNIINASLDLGHTKLETIRRIVIPYSYKTVIAVLFLIFLPSISCISVADFLNKSNGSKLIAQTINDLVEAGGKQGIGINRLSFLTLVLVLLIYFVYLLFKYSSRAIYKLWKSRYE